MARFMSYLFGAHLTGMNYFTGVSTAGFGNYLRTVGVRGSRPHRAIGARINFGRRSGLGVCRREGKSTKGEGEGDCEGLGPHPP